MEHERARGGRQGSGSADRTQARREFLQKAGVASAAAGVAWVTPQLTSVAGAAPCSAACTPVETSWLSSGLGAGTNMTSAPRVINGSTVTSTRTNSQTITNGNFTTGVISGSQLGGVTGVLPITRIASSSPQSASMTFNFAPAVSRLRFTLLDIDAFNDGQVNYREQVTIVWTTGTGSPMPAYTPGANISFISANTYGMVAPVDTNCAATDVACNLLVDFSDSCGTITSLTINTNNPNTPLGSSNEFGRVVGIGPFSFCIQ